MQIGVSYTALKHWIHIGRIRTVKTAGGHHRVPLDVIYEFLPPKAAQAASSIGCQNQLAGTVREVTVDGLVAEIILEIEGHEVSAIITAQEALDLDLKPGESAILLIKSTSFIVGCP